MLGTLSRLDICMSGAQLAKTKEGTGLTFFFFKTKCLMDLGSLKEMKESESPAGVGQLWVRVQPPLYHVASLGPLPPEH